MATTSSYSFWVGLRKTVINLAIVGIPLLIQVLPAEWMNLTVSGVLLLAINYLKNR